MKKTEFKPEQKDPSYRINGSGLFHFKSRLSQREKTEILDWFDSLTIKQKGFVMTLRREVMEETEFFSNSEF